MKINYKSLPVYVDKKEVKKKLEEENKKYDNWEHDIRLNSNTILKMEFNYGSLKWDCVNVYMNGYKLL